jgi:diguanylate cyclase (GGDEF)-like protein
VARLAARLGGDEFAVVLTGLRDTAEATAVARRIRAALNEPMRVVGTEFTVGASIGVVTWSTRAATPGGAGPDGQRRPGLDRLLNDADTAMYLAKSRGTGYEVVAEPFPADSVRRPVDGRPGDERR